MKHPCQILYETAGSGIIYGEEAGICRITGAKSLGIPFEKWVKPTFTDWGYLKPGTIISNEALFCFDEKSAVIQKKTGRDKPQKFRSYSHIISGGQWYCLTKADKQKIFELIISGAEIVSLTDTGQKHVFFKHKLGMWQLDELFVRPNIPILKKIHQTMRKLLLLGFSQSEIITGQYRHDRIMRAGLLTWKFLEKELAAHRGTGLFDFASWMLFLTEAEKASIQKNIKSKGKK